MISGVVRAPENSVRGFDIGAVDAANGIGVGSPDPNVAQNSGLNVGGLFNDISQTQSDGQNGRKGSGPIDSKTADEPAKGAPAGTSSILNGQNPSTLSNESTSQGQGQIFQPGAGRPQEQGSGSGQLASGNGQSSVDISALLNSNTPGQNPKGSGSINSNNIAGDIANQLIDGNARPLDGQGQRQGQGQANAQAAGANGILVKIGSTVIVEPNGQQIRTEIVEAVGQQSAAPAPAPAAEPPQAQAPPAEAQPTPPAEPQAQMPPEARPSEGKAMPLPMPMGEMPAKGQNSTNVAEGMKPAPEAQAMPSATKSLKAAVRITKLNPCTVF